MQMLLFICALPAYIAHMGQAPHIIIIGAGLIGLSTADALLSRGARVTVLEKLAGPGQGAGFYNSGMIHPSQARPWNWPDLDAEKYEASTRAVYALAQRSTDLLRGRIAELGLDTSRLKSTTRLIFDSISVGRSLHETYKQFGIPVSEEPNGPWTFGRYVLSFPDDGCANAYIYSQALAADLKARGAQFLYNAGDCEIICTADKFRHIDLGGQILSGDHIIIAAGHKSADLLSPLGVAVPLYDEPGFAQNFARPDMDLPDMPIMHHASRSALTVFDNHLRLSGTAGETGPEALSEIWEEIAPEIFEKLGSPLQEWQGVRPMSRLGRPIIGPTAISGLWVNSGHGHMGWTLCAGSGALMAEMILDGQAAPDFAMPDGLT